MKILRMILLVILAITSIYTYTPYFYTKVDPEIVPYFNEYKKIVLNKCGEVKELNQHYVIEFSTLDEGILGVCLLRPTRFTIQISSSWWNKLSEADRFQLIAHESFHCIFNEPHSSDPNSFMYASMNVLTKNETIQQINKLLEIRCEKH